MPTKPLVPPSAATLTEVMGPATLGETEMGFGMWSVDEGLLVTRDMPAAAFLVTKTEVKALPGFFEGLHTPVPEWDALDFSISKVKGKLADLSFMMSAPASGEEREVRGTTKKWKVGAKTPRPPVWLSPDSISLPIELPSGTRVFERAAGYQSPAKLGFQFEREGPSKGDKMPVPAPGTKGCKHRLLGHPILTVLPHGGLLGLGIECKSGDDLVTTAKLDGVAWPYQTIVPRFSPGALMAEIWSNGSSRVVPIPGAEHIAEFAGASVSMKDENDLVVVSQVPGPNDSQAFVAQFDGTAFKDVTPPHPPFWLEPRRTLDGSLFLFGDGRGFRRTGPGWTDIVYELLGGDDLCKQMTPYQFAEPTSEAALYLAATGTCLWRLGKGETFARRIPLPPDARVADLLVFDGAAHALVEHDRSASLYRLSPGR